MPNRAAIISDAIKGDLAACDGLTAEDIKREEFEKEPSLDLDLHYGAQPELDERERSNLFAGYDRMGYPYTSDQLISEVRLLEPPATTEELEKLCEAADGPRADLRPAADTIAQEQSRRETRGIFGRSPANLR